MVATPNRQMS